MKHTPAILFVVVCVLVQYVCGVQVWETALDKSKLLVRSGDLNPVRGTASTTTNIAIGSDVYQEVYGFGGTLTESAAMLFISMKKKDANNYVNVLRTLFDPSVGAGMQVIRIPMGSSDFSKEPYFTYADVPYDWFFDKWSWGRDADYMLPVLKDILQINPNIKIMITPWTAPKWMKTNAGYDNAFFWGGLSPASFDNFAYYFQVTIQKFKAQGINIYALSMQNEPENALNSYPVMGLSPQDESALAKLIGKKLKDNNINTKILVYDHNWIDPQYPIQAMSDPSALPYIAGTAFHCYNGTVNAQLDVYDAHKDKEIWFTECSGHGPSNFPGNIPWNTNNLYIGAVKNWARTVMHWSLALDPDHGPKAPGGCPDCRGIITVSSDSYNIDKNEEYYGLAMFGKFLKSPSYRLGCNLTGGWGCVNSICFKNADSSIVIAVGNFCDDPQSIVVQNQGSYVQTTVLRGLTTFVW